MKYLKEQPFLDRKGNQVLIPTQDEAGNRTAFEPSLRWVLGAVANSYTPTDKFSLSLKEIRSLNTAVDVLEKEIELDEYMSFEEADFILLKKVILHLLPLVGINQILMNSPEVEDILNSPLNELSTDKDNEE